MSKVRIGFVGVGGMGQCAHLKNYASIGECEVVAIAEVRQELGKRVAAKYGVTRVYASHTEMLANEKLDGIVSAQPFTRHGQPPAPKVATLISLYHPYNKVALPVARS